MGGGQGGPKTAVSALTGTSRSFGRCGFSRLGHGTVRRPKKQGRRRSGKAGGKAGDSERGAAAGAFHGGNGRGCGKPAWQAGNIALFASKAIGQAGAVASTVVGPDQRFRKCSKKV